jgi:hypothetical protein
MLQYFKSNLSLSLSLPHSQSMQLYCVRFVNIVFVAVVPALVWRPDVQQGTAPTIVPKVLYASRRDSCPTTISEIGITCTIYHHVA